MAKKNKTTKSINYRRFVVQTSQARTLQQILSAALGSVPKPADRYEALNAQSTELRCIGKHVNIHNCLCGYMTSFERGAVQPAVSDDPNAASLRLGAISPPAPKAGSAAQQFVPGVVYFAIFNNHVVMVATHAMRASTFEAHLNWLLKGRTNQLPATTAFALSDEAQKATKEKIRKSHVKAIALGQPLMSEMVVQSPKAGGTSKEKMEKKTVFKPEGPMYDLIKTFFADEAQFERLGLDEVFDGNLEVWIEIRYPKYKRSKPEDAVKLMDSLGLALRDIEGDQVSLELQNGHRVSGKDLKISGVIEVPTTSSGLPDEDAMFASMVDWLRLQIKNAVIDA